MNDMRRNRPPKFMRRELVSITTPAPVVNFLPPLPEKTDEKVWMEAWCHVASASNTTDKEACDSWADHCLASFKERFR